MDKVLKSCCFRVENGDNYFNNLNNNDSIGTIIVADYYKRIIAFAEYDILRILMSKKHGKFNIIYRSFDSYKDIKEVMQNESVDLYLGLKSIEKPILDVSSCHWFQADFNLVILSSLYTDIPKISNYLVATFSGIIWILILCSAFVIASHMIVHRKLIEGKPVTTKEFFDAFIKLLVYLLNQSLSKSNYVLINVWSIEALLLMSHYTSNMFSSLMNTKSSTINSFEQLIDSNVTIYSGNYSYLYFSIEWLHHNNNTKFKTLKPILRFIDDYNEDLQLKLLRNISKGKYAYIRDGFTIEMRNRENPQLKLAIGEQKYFQLLQGYPINKIYTKSRERLYNIMKIIAESGINERINSRILLFHKFLGERKLSDRTEDDHLIHFKYRNDLIILLSGCFAFSMLFFILEKLRIN